jgi:hypothetical protein
MGKEESPAVAEARAKFESADEFTSYAREVELEAAIIEDEEPAVSTEEATRRAKEEVGHPDPFNTVGTITAEAEVKEAKAARAEVKEAKKGA